MQDLIEALQILLKYGNPDNPTHCEHDQLTVVINPESVSPEDLSRLEELGFIASNEAFISYRYGSA